MSVEIRLETITLDDRVWGKTLEELKSAGQALVKNSLGELALKYNVQLVNLDVFKGRYRAYVRAVPVRKEWVDIGTFRGETKAGIEQEAREVARKFFGDAEFEIHRTKFFYSNNGPDGPYWYAGYEVSFRDGCTDGEPLVDSTQKKEQPVNGSWSDHTGMSS